MAQKITIRDNSTEGSLSSTDINADDYIYISSDQSNVGASNILYKAAEITVKYDNLQWSGSGGVPELQAVIEAKADNGQYFPIGYQFNPFRIDYDGQFHTIVVDPNVFWSDAGVSNIVYVGGRTIGEVSPQQVALPTDWRICVHVKTPTGSTLDNIDIDIAAELVNREN